MQIKQAVENNNLYTSTIKAIEEENGAIAWNILQIRADYEYEEYEIIEPINL